MGRHGRYKRGYFTPFIHGDRAWWGPSCRCLTWFILKCVPTTQREPHPLLPRARERWILNPSDGRGMYHDTWKQSKQQEIERSRERMRFRTIPSRWYLHFGNKVKYILGCHSFLAIVNSWREGDNPNHLVVQTYWSTCIISPNMGGNEKCLKPPPSVGTHNLQS